MSSLLHRVHDKYPHPEGAFGGQTTGRPRTYGGGGKIY
jgi:hypothetical protein